MRSSGCRRGVAAVCVIAGALLSAVRPAAQAVPSSQRRIQDRTYKLKEADGLAIPYSVYVPRTYSRARKWPLIVALHGNGALASDLIRYKGFTNLAERHGYILVAPTGYSTRGAYGVPGRGQGLQPDEPGF